MAASATNRVPNPSFELGTAGWQAGTEKGVTTLAQSTDWARVGDASAYVLASRTDGRAQSLTTAMVPQLTNLVKNPSLEVDAAGWSGPVPGANFTPDGSNQGRNSLWSERGTYSFRASGVAPTTAGMFIALGTATTLQSVVPGESVLLRIRVRFLAHLGGLTVARISFNDSGGAPLSAGALDINSPTSTAPGEYDMVAAGVVPAGAVTAGLNLRTGSNVGGNRLDVAVDGAVFVRGTQVSGYFDGDTPGYAWSGTPHASTSVPVANAGIPVTGDAVYHARLSAQILRQPESSSFAVSFYDAAGLPVSTAAAVLDNRTGAHDAVLDGVVPSSASRAALAITNPLTAGPVNYVRNPALRTALTDWTAAAYTGGVVTGALARVTSDGPPGETTSAEVSATLAGTTSQLQAYPTPTAPNLNPGTVVAAPGSRWSIGAWIKVAAGATVTSSAGIGFKDASGAYLGGGGGVAVTPTMIVGEWQYYELRGATALANTALVYGVVDAKQTANFGTTVTLRVGRVVLVNDVRVPAEFIDGSVAGYAWSGAANLSPSRKVQTLELYADAALYAEGAERPPYLDGDQPGYKWEGAAHASRSVPDASFEPTEPPDLLGDLPYLLQGADDVGAATDAMARELGRVEDARRELIANFFPQSAERLLAQHELLLGLPPDPGQTVAQRRQTVLAYFQSIGSSGSTTDWVDTLTRALGSGWTWEEHDASRPASPPAYTVRVLFPYQRSLSAPTGLAATPSTTGGSMAGGTYFYVVTATNNWGETKISNRVSAAVTGPTGRVALDWPDVVGATGYRVYRGTASGQEVHVADVAVSALSDTGLTGTGMGWPLNDTTASPGTRDAEALARRVTPAHVALTFGYGQGFILGVSHLSHDAL